MYNDGKRGERIFKNIMESRNYKVEDVREDPEYQLIDIDFVVTSPTTGLRKTFEVKYDARIHRTNNLYLEISNIFSKQWKGSGWYNHCKADYLVYGDQQVNKFYVIPMKKLRKRVEELPVKVARCGNESTGLLVSLDDIKDLYEIL